MHKISLYSEPGILISISYVMRGLISGEREGGGRLSMWGEQLHDKLFAKKDMKEVMRNKLKLNLKDESNDSPQNCHTNIK